MQSIDTLTVYLGSSGRARDVFQQSAVDLGKAIAAAGKALVYGGMDAGLMGLLAINAHESGANVTGIIPDKLKDSERLLPGLYEEVHVDTLAQRKALMFERADAVIALPGGFGTLDESLEVLYWGNLALHWKPIVFVDIEGYWGALLAYLKTLLDYDPRFLIAVQKVEDVFPALDAWPALPCHSGESRNLEEQNKKDPGLRRDDKIVYPHFEDIIAQSTEPLIFDTATIESTYFLITALGLKQLGKHTRPIGLLNDKGQFDGLIDWIETAHREKFITDKCLKLFDHDTSADTLKTKLSAQTPPEINLHTEKWGDRRKNPRG